MIQFSMHAIIRRNKLIRRKQVANIQLGYYLMFKLDRRNCSGKTTIVINIYLIAGTLYKDYYC